MKIGYLHIGLPQHGVCRYGHFLAAEARNRSDLEVIEAKVVLTEDRELNKKILSQAAHQLSQADVVHFQSSGVNDLLWGEDWLQLEYLNVFMQYCSRPLVVTLHDVIDRPYSVWDIVLHAYHKLKPNPVSKPANAVHEVTLNEPEASKRSISERAINFSKMVLRSRFGSEAQTIRQLVKKASLVFVCTEEESRKLSSRIRTTKLRVLPHFVEQRSVKLITDQARAELGLEGVKVVTLLGFIHPPKGHELVINAMPYLPKHIKVVFAGGPCVGGDEAYVNALIKLAKDKEVIDRLVVTGYLSESDLEKYLVATDLAICPFVSTSASGSLSTWISVGKSVLASNIPQILEINRLVPNAIKTFAPYTPVALAERIQELIGLDESDDLEICKLREQFSLSTIFERHLSYYQSIIPHND